MKKTILILLTAFSVSYTTTLAQVKTKVVTKPSNANATGNTTAATPANNKTIADCKQISGSIVETTLTAGAFQTLDCKLDHKEGFLKIGNTRSSFNIAEHKINKPGHNWVYSVNDINSFKHLLKAEKNNFYLYIEFEGNGNELKGKCPGCANAFEDSRAPDINWEGKRVARIQLKPVAYQNSISFQVQEVELEGKFDINGPMDIFLPTINFLELAMKKTIESQLKKYLNNAVVKKQIADAFKPVVEKTGFNKIQNVYMSQGQLFICGATVQKVNIK